MFLDFIEVGTSDFQTLIQEADDETRGISIDPVGAYLDRLPNLKSCVKINAAISSFEGETNVYYILPDKISSLQLPEWVRGCNSVGGPHPTVERLLNERNLPMNDIVTIETVPVCRLSTVIANSNATGVFQLKVDTEGHDHIIVNDYLRNCARNLFPHRVSFESNILSDNNELHELIANLVFMGYDVIKCETGGPATDTFLRLNIRRIKNRSFFTNGIQGYFLQDYPDNYSPTNPPHNNTLADAQTWCFGQGYGGVTFQYGRFEVRKGEYLMKDKNYDLISWILL